jgi:type I restriction enzyme S subunit
MKLKFASGALEKFCNVEYGTRVVRKNDAGTIYPVYGGGGATFYLDTYNREDRVVVARFAMSEQCTRRVAGKFALNDSGLTLSTKDSLVLRQDLLDYLILSLNDDIYDSARGTAQKNLDVPGFRNMMIYFPLGESEQKTIVEKLDAVFAEIDQLEELCIRNLNAVSELHRAYIHGLLSRIDVTPKYLNQISENFDSKRRPITKSSRNAGEYPYYGASGIVDYVEEYIFDGEYLLISEDGANLLARSTPIAFPAHGKFWVNNHAHIIQCSTLMDQTFLEFFFNSTDVSAFVTGAAQPKLSQASLHKIPIPFPDTASERAQIVSRIESSSTEIETLLSNLKSQRKMYSELRSSFLSSAFTEESDAA